MPNLSNQRKRTIFSSGQHLQQRQSDQEDSAFQSSQSFSNSQMMNSQQDNSQGSSFDLFSQMMSQQQGFSQQNEIAPSHRFYTKYMSKAPLFPRESSQSDRNPLPRRRSYQDLQEVNKQKAKDRDDRDLINTFIALVKECADEVKSAADEIKSNVDMSMKESANKSATIMKKLNDDLSEHYNTLLDSIKDKEAEKDKVAELEQSLAAKEARIEVLESQLEIAKKAKEERVIQSVVDAYTVQQKLNRDHIEKLHEEQQKFTKEQVEIIQKTQDQMEKSHTVAFSEKQPAKSLNAVPVNTSESADAVVSANRASGFQANNQQQSLPSNLDVLQASTVLNNTSMQMGMSSTVTTLQPTQPLQSSMPQQVSTQMTSCQPSFVNHSTCDVREDQRCSSRGYCSEYGCQLPNCNTSMIPLQAATVPACNINPSINRISLFPNPQRQGNHVMQAQYQQQYSRRSDVGDVSCFPQQPPLPSRPSTNVSINMHSNDAALYAMTSPLQDNPTSNMWSRANRLRPSPVATVAPQVKDETFSPENNSDDIQEIVDSTQQSSDVQVQQRSSRRTSRKETSQVEPRRHSARVQARSLPIASDKQGGKSKPKNQTRTTGSKMQNQKQQLQQQKQIGLKRMYEQQSVPKQQRKSAASRGKQKQQQAEDVYEFNEESRHEDAHLEAPVAKRVKKSKGLGQMQQTSNYRVHKDSHQSVSDYSKPHGIEIKQHESYSTWATQPAKTNSKKTKLQEAKKQKKWIFEDSESTADEYEFEDDSQCSVESTDEQIQQTNKPFGQKYANQVKKSVQHYESRDIVQPYYDENDESSEEMSFSIHYPQSPGVAVHPKRKPTITEQVVPMAVDDFLSTPCLQAQQYDSEDSQLVTGFTGVPGSVVRRKVSRQVERRRRLQAVVRQADSSTTLAKITQSISKHRQKLKRSSSLLSLC